VRKKNDWSMFEMVALMVKEREERGRTSCKLERVQYVQLAQPEAGVGESQ